MNFFQITTFGLKLSVYGLRVNYIGSIRYGLRDNFFRFYNLRIIAFALNLTDCLPAR